MKRKFLLPLIGLIALPLLSSFTHSQTLYENNLKLSSYDKKNYIISIEDIKYNETYDNFAFIIYCKNIGEDYISYRGASMKYTYKKSSSGSQEYIINPFAIFNDYGDYQNDGYIAPGEEFTYETVSFRPSYSGTPSSVTVDDFKFSFSLYSFDDKDIQHLTLSSYEYTLYESMNYSFLNVKYSANTDDFKQSFLLGRLLHNGQAYFDTNYTEHKDQTTFTSLFRYNIDKGFKVSDNTSFSVIALKQYDKSNNGLEIILIAMLAIIFVPAIVVIIGIIVLICILKKMKNKRNQTN